MKNADDQETRRTLTRRALVLGAAQFVLTGALIVRLHHLQVTESDNYQGLSEDNQFDIVVVPVSRGLVRDRQGRGLAVNRDLFRISVIAERAENLQETLQQLRRLIVHREFDAEPVLRSAAERKNRFQPIVVVDGLSRRDVARIAVRAPYMPGIRIEVGRSRHYPYGESAVHVTGYVAPVSATELSDDPALGLPGARIGKSGIEHFFEAALRGISGRRQVEVNAAGQWIRELPVEDGASGANLTLTLDAELQQQVSLWLERGPARVVPRDSWSARRALDGHRRPELGLAAGHGLVNLDRGGALAPPESGAAIVMDIHRGEVLALASTPGFDPNAFNKGLTPRDWNRLLSNRRSPMINKAIAGWYPPGSIFKPIVCLAALERRAVTVDEKVDCRGFMELGDSRFHCWHSAGHGPVNMEEALEQSCDVYFYELARRLGIGPIAEMARRFGFGDTLGVELPGERSGLVPGEEWKQAKYGEPWQEGETLISGIGQGFLLATPLQMVTMMARLANGARAVVPRLVLDEQARSVSFGRLGIPKDHLAVVMRGLWRAVNGYRATAASIRDRQLGFEVAGKTGSVQVRRITEEERRTGKLRNEDLPREQRDHALFVGVAPADRPAYATCVLIEHGGSGGAVAAPIAGEILARTIRNTVASGSPRVVPLPQLAPRRDDAT